MEIVIRSVPPPRPQISFENHWAYAVVSALLEPKSESGWSFLRAAALNQFADRWVDSGAIQALKLIASARSTAILEETRDQNSDRALRCSKAIEYIMSRPPVLVDASLERLARPVAEVNRIGAWRENRNTRYNAGGDKALVDIVYATSEDVFVHTATFHRVGGLWRLRGIRETLQQFTIGVVVPPAGTFEDPTPPITLVDPKVMIPTVDDLLRSLPFLKPPTEPAPTKHKK